MLPFHLSISATPPDPAECMVCFLTPCACSFIAKLEPGGRLHWLYDVAAAEVGRPLPHRGGCPCPRCYSRCLGSWTQEERMSRSCSLRCLAYGALSPSLYS
jgi:hypothetical protein